MEFRDRQRQLAGSLWHASNLRYDLSKLLKFSVCLYKMRASDWTINFSFGQCWVFTAAQAFFSYGEKGLLFGAVHGLLIAVASLIVEQGL